MARPGFIGADRLQPGEYDSVDKLHEFVCGMMEDGFKKNGYAPCWWFFRAPDPFAGDGYFLTIIDTPWANEAEKRASVLTMRNMLKTMRATHYSFVSEVWIVNVDDVKNYDNSIQPRFQPEREDVLLVQTFDRHGHFAMSRWPVFYPKDKRHIKTPTGGTFGVLQKRRNWADDPGKGEAHFAGQMFNLFAPEEQVLTSKKTAEELIAELLTKKKQGPVR